MATRPRMTARATGFGLSIALALLLAAPLSVGAPTPEETLDNAGGKWEAASAPIPPPLRETGAFAHAEAGAAQEKAWTIAAERVALPTANPKTTVAGHPVEVETQGPRPEQRGRFNRYVGTVDADVAFVTDEAPLGVVHVLPAESPLAHPEAAPRIPVSAVAAAAPGSGAAAPATRAQDAPREPPAEELPRRASGGPISVGERATRAPDPALLHPAFVLPVLVALAIYVAVLTLSSRLVPERVLEHPRRRAIYDLLTERPGSRRFRVASALSLPRKLATYHLDRLVRARLVVEEDGRFFVAGAPRNVAGVRALEPPLAHAILATVTSAPAGLRLSEVSAAVGSSPQLAAYHLKKLLAARAIQSEGAGSLRIYRPPA